MASQNQLIVDKIYPYYCTVAYREAPILSELRDETAKLPESVMQIAPEQGQFLNWLVKLFGAKHILEIGTFTGYSALCMALALPADGKLIACDHSAEWTAIAQRYWQTAGVADKIRLHLGPALTTLDNLLAEGAVASFDLIFLDADKIHYDQYYEKGLALLRTGGVIAIDNVLNAGDWFASDETGRFAGSREIKALNEKIQHDERVDASMVVMGGGMNLVRKR